MKHQCLVTDIDKKCYPQLQERYLADPQCGPYPCFEVGQEHLFEREPGKDDFYHFGRELDPPFPCASSSSSAHSSVVAGAPSRATSGASSSMGPRSAESAPEAVASAPAAEPVPAPVPAPVPKGPRVCRRPPSPGPPAGASAVARCAASLGCRADARWGMPAQRLERLSAGSEI